MTSVRKDQVKWGRCRVMCRGLGTNSVAQCHISAVSHYIKPGGITGFFELLSVVFGNIYLFHLFMPILQIAFKYCSKVWGQSPMRHLFDQKYSKNSNIVKYYYKNKINILINFKM